MRLIVVFLMLMVSPILSAAERVKVLTSFSILADITRNIGGAEIELTNLVGPDSDAHLYETTPDDARRVAAADLIIVNGLNFEPWLDRLATSTGANGKVVQASQGVIPRTLEEDGQQIPDPHAWNNLANAKIYAGNIAKALARVDPAHAERYRANLEAYLSQIDALLIETRERFGGLPAGSHRIVTSHDAFGYLGQAYGIDFIAPQGLSTEHEPSAREVADLIGLIRSEGIKAVFVENIKDARLLEQIADETGARIGGTLYSDALASEGPASAYLGLYRHNVETITRALARR
ncbi:metal ABC transporter substrate-binding protein [Stutzerimonas azotifigens]|uniref:metal ABC transporter substrate-binding protein n=1 Tax=Stutzerimonas azotifigens TaxID=291995 RepID=UPI0004177C84|nr:metal ABC transporter substrate-binding protein [Stutzerimonas azotifigens]